MRVEITLNPRNVKQDNRKIGTTATKGKKVEGRARLSSRLIESNAIDEREERLSGVRIEKFNRLIAAIESWIGTRFQNVEFRKRMIVFLATRKNRWIKWSKHEGGTITILRYTKRGESKGVFCCSLAKSICWDICC